MDLAEFRRLTVPAAERSGASAGSQPYHAFPAPDGAIRSREDTKAPALEFRRPPAEPGRTLEEIQPRRFGTVRPRVQIPGPRPISEYDPVRHGSCSDGDGSQLDHNFSRSLRSSVC